MPDIRIAAYRARRDVASMADVGGRVPAGDIIVRGAVILLGCPCCTALQFAARAVTGFDEAPNVLEPVQCGAGACRRCGVWFRIVTGRPELVERPPGRALAIPAALRVAGVREPPEQP